MSKNLLNLTRIALLNTKKMLNLHSSTWFYLRNPFLHSFMIDCLRLTQFSGENSLSFSIKLSFSSWVFSEGSVFWAEFFCWRTKKKPGLWDCFWLRNHLSFETISWMAGLHLAREEKGISKSFFNSLKYTKVFTQTQTSLIIVISFYNISWSP